MQGNQTKWDELREKISQYRATLSGIRSDPKSNFVLRNRIIDAVLCGNWDWYRNSYSMFTHEDKVAICSSWYDKYPQVGRVSNAIDDMISLSIVDCSVNVPVVLDIGCHDGSFADKFLAVRPYRLEWRGYDINISALIAGIERQIENGCTYCYDIDLNFAHRPIHEIHKAFDGVNVLVMSHTAEHMSVYEFCSIINSARNANIKNVVIEVPRLSSTGVYGGNNSHVANMDELTMHRVLSDHYYFAWKMSTTERGDTAWRFRSCV